MKSRSGLSSRSGLLLFIEEPLKAVEPLRAVYKKPLRAVQKD